MARRHLHLDLSKARPKGFDQIANLKRSSFSRSASIFGIDETVFQPNALSLTPRTEKEDSLRTHLVDLEDEQSHLPRGSGIISPRIDNYEALEEEEYALLNSELCWEKIREAVDLIFNGDALPLTPEEYNEFLYNLMPQQDAVYETILKLLEEKMEKLGKSIVLNKSPKEDIRTFIYLWKKYFDTIELAIGAVLVPLDEETDYNLHLTARDDYGHLLIDMEMLRSVYLEGKMRKLFAEKCLLPHLQRLHECVVYLKTHDNQSNKPDTKVSTDTTIISQLPMASLNLSLGIQKTNSEEPVEISSSLQTLVDSTPHLKSDSQLLFTQTVHQSVSISSNNLPFPSSSVVQASNPFVACPLNSFAPFPSTLALCQKTPPVLSPSIDPNPSCFLMEHSKSITVSTQSSPSSSSINLHQPINTSDMSSHFLQLPHPILQPNLLNDPLIGTSTLLHNMQSMGLLLRPFISMIDAQSSSEPFLPRLNSFLALLIGQSVKPFSIEFLDDPNFLVQLDNELCYPRSSYEYSSEDNDTNDDA